MPRFKPLGRKPTLSDAVVARLNQSMRQGGLRPGDRLPSEQALARDFGVARTVVREAISQLRYDGVLESRVGVGAFVAEPGERRAFRIGPQCFAKRKDLLKLMRLRTGVAVEAAREAAESRDGDDLARLDAVLSELDAAAADARDGAERHYEAERQLVALIARAARNDMAANFLAMIDGQIAGMRSVAVKHARAAELAADARAEMAALVAAIRAGDAPGAAATAQAHFENAANRLADRADIADV